MLAAGYTGTNGAKRKPVAVEDRTRKPRGIDLSRVVLVMRVDGQPIFTAVLVCEGACKDWRKHDKEGDRWICAHCAASRRWG